MSRKDLLTWKRKGFVAARLKTTGEIHLMTPKMFITLLASEWIEL